uniref:Glucan endo-1,3-beta-glucosidase n=1 Tax=Cacopsylla melanoneura TaxID=428564 RepID=A0A8D8QUW8_9HEMI
MERNYCVVLLLGLLSITDAQVGVCYGRLGDNLPPPNEVVALCKQYNIQRMRIYDAKDSSVLQALAGSNIQLLVDLPGGDLQKVSSSDGANQWVQNNIKSHPDVNFRYIAVGNEVKPGDPAAQYVVPAMQNIQNALNAAGLGNKIKVSTSIETGALGNSYPPSQGAFSPAYMSAYLDGAIKFLVQNGSPLLVNVYPYFAYMFNQNVISLEYALFTSPSVVVQDGSHGYQNLFDAIMDATYSALEKAGAGNVEIVVSETGWPSGGGVATTPDNEKTYNTKLVAHIKNGTPKRPGKSIETYLFDLFDENQKNPEYEKHWGQFLPNKQPKFNLNFS